MKVKSKVAKYGERKIAEIPKAVRDNFKIGEDVTIEKSKQPSVPRRKTRKGRGVKIYSKLCGVLLLS